MISIKKITLPDITFKDPLIVQANPIVSYKSTMGDIKVNETPAKRKEHGHTIATWFKILQESIPKFNVNTSKEPKLLQINSNLPSNLATTAKKFCATVKIYLPHHIGTLNIFELSWLNTRLKSSRTSNQDVKPNIK